MSVDWHRTWPSHPVRLHVVLFSPADAWDFHEWRGVEPFPSPGVTQDAAALGRRSWESPVAPAEMTRVERP